MSPCFVQGDAYLHEESYRFYVFNKPYVEEERALLWGKNQKQLQVWFNVGEIYEQTYFANYAQHRPQTVSEFLAPALISMW